MNLIETKIILTDDSFIKETIYKGKSKEVIKETGKTQWNKEGSSITLLGLDLPNQYFVGPSCDYDSDRWVQSMGYAYISSVSKISGTGNVQIGTNRYYYWKKYLNTFNSCSTVRGAGSTNTSHPSHFP